MSPLTAAAIVLLSGLAGGAVAYLSILAFGRAWDAAMAALDADIASTTGGA